jgi:RNA polymerase sigma factor (sigma-70 family)
MARVFERWDRVSAMESPGGYVYRVAVHLNGRRLRRLALHARRVAVVGRHNEGTEGPHVRSELAEALAVLARGQREAFLLVEWLGMSSEQAGEVLGIAPASVRSRLHRARELLRRRFMEGEHHG